MHFTGVCGLVLFGLENPISKPIKIYGLILIRFDIFSNRTKKQRIKLVWIDRIH